MRPGFKFSSKTLKDEKTVKETQTEVESDQTEPKVETESDPAAS